MNCSRLRYYCLLSILFYNFCFASLVAHASTTESKLLSSVSQAQWNQGFWLGVQLTLPTGWHTYWRNPGDSGKAIELDWQLPDYVTLSDIYWPTPAVIPVEPFVSYGYKDTVLFPIKITAKTDQQHTEQAKQLKLTAQARWLICETVCIPETATLTLTLPISHTTAVIDSTNNRLIEAALAKHPDKTLAAQYLIEAQQLQLDITLASLVTKPITAAYFFPFANDLIEYQTMQRWQQYADNLRLQLPSKDSSTPVVSGLLSLTFADNTTTAFNIIAAKATTTLPALPNTTTQTLLPLWQILLFALLGGLILNLMPCVFPILALKALAIMNHSESEAHTVRKQGIAFTFGVVLSMLLLAGLLLLLRAGGAQLGWGFQLQSTGFITFLLYLFFAIGLNLSGLLPLPNGLVGIGQKLSEQSGLVGAFFTGILATLVATPCSAPFMAAALGVALTQTAPIALLIFTMLGLGLAAPLLGISFFPVLQRYLPQPGSWMVTLKQALAFPMYASALWLLWVLGQQTDIDQVIQILTGILLLAIIAWLYTLQLKQRSLIGGLLLLATLIIWIYQQLPQIGSAKDEAPGSITEAYTAERLQYYRAQGKAVFINLTADWCITCLANERLVLRTDKIQTAFRKQDIVYLKGDWTTADPKISALLQQFNRSGVPLYLLYFPIDDARDVIVLPQLLTKNIVLAAINNI